MVIKNAKKDFFIKPPKKEKEFKNKEFKKRKFKQMVQNKGSLKKKKPLKKRSPPKTKGSKKRV
ncbi:hypothetical protein HMPREF1403_01692 [Helicobacter pylori GAM201Ai]|nr:hypothetical protein HMPREF1403_01692 [Helicobacter pylori GAM201Ai]